MKKVAFLGAVTLAMLGSPMASEARAADGVELNEKHEARRKLLKTPVAKLDLSKPTRSLLAENRMKILGHIVRHSKDGLKKRGFGKKALSELEELVADKGLSFGMDVSKYNLDDD